VIAAAGDRALDAVAWGAGQVIAVDANPTQLRLSALKVLAAGSLDTPDLIALFSIGRHRDVRRLYRAELRPRLDEGDRDYWDRWIGIFLVGLHQHHPVGVAMWVLGALLRAIGGRELKRMIVSAPDAAAQARWYEARLRGRYWNRLTRAAMASPALLRWVVVHGGERESMREQGFREWLEPRISGAVARSLIRENPYWMPLLSGRQVAPDFETTWLRPGSKALIRHAPERIRLILGSVVDAVESLPEASLDAVDLSNVPDWLSAAELTRLWEGLSRALAPGGRVVLRSAYRDPPLPMGAAATALALDSEVSTELTEVERTGIYANVSVLRRAAAGGHVEA
jgi:betaine lipid synthase